MLVAAEVGSGTSFGPGHYGGNAATRLYSLRKNSGSRHVLEGRGFQSVRENVKNCNSPGV